MATSLKTDLQVSVKHVFTNPLDLSTAKDELTLNIPITLTNGTAAGMADVVFHDERTLTTGASEDLDLAGTMTNAFGTTVTFAKIKAILIYNTSTVRTLTIGGASFNGWISRMGSSTHTFKIGPGGFDFFYEPVGFAVTADTADLLKILNDSGTSCIYRIWIVGTSA